MSTSPYTTNATIPIGGSYNALLYILGDIFIDNTQELIPILTNTQFMAFSVPSDSVGFKIYNTTQALMYAWTGSSWSVVNDATAANLVANTILGQTIINISSTNPPSANQVLVATSPTTATWQNQSGSGGGGIPNPYVYNQVIPANIWTINHGLGTYPVVVVVDSAGNTFVGDVQYVTTNQLTITFTTVFGGTAYLT